MNQGKRLILLSNMYPSASHPGYGIFVKRFSDQVGEQFVIRRTVLTKRDTFPGKLGGYISLYIRSMLVLLRSKKDDLIYVHYPLYFAPVLLILLAIRRKTFLNFHGSDAVFDTVFKNLFKRLLAPIVLRSTVIVPSSSYAKLVQAIWSLDPARIHVYPSGGVDRNVFRPQEVNNKVLTLGFVGNFIGIKGWQVFLEALNLLKTNQLSYQAIMVGAGPDEEKIRAFIQSHDLRVQIMDKMPQNELVKVYARMDILVFPSYRESLGLVGLEAMMCGIPVIASDIPGPASYLSEGVNGYLFPKGDAASLAAKIVRFNDSHQAEKEEMKESCIETAMRFESSQVKKEILNILNGVV